MWAVFRPLQYTCFQLIFLPLEKWSLVLCLSNYRQILDRDPSSPRPLLPLKSTSLFPPRFCRPVFSLQCVKLQCGGLRAVPGAQRPCAPSGSAFLKPKKKAESERRGMLNWLVVWLNIFRALSQAKHMVPVLIKQLFWGGNARELKAGIQSQYQPSHVLNRGDIAEDSRGARDASWGTENLRRRRTQSAFGFQRGLLSQAPWASACLAGHLGEITADKHAGKAGITPPRLKSLVSRFGGYEHPEQIRVTHSEMDPLNFWTLKLAFVSN